MQNYEINGILKRKERRLCSMFKILSFGLSELGCGLSELSCGLSELSCGLSKLSCGLSELSCELSELSCGLSELSCELSELSCGLSELSCGLSELGCGLSELSCGLSELSCGLSTISVEFLHSEFPSNYQSTPIPVYHPCTNWCVLYNFHCCKTLLAQTRQLGFVWFYPCCSRVTTCVSCCSGILGSKQGSRQLHANSLTHR
jgi:hypothetical protein